MNNLELLMSANLIHKHMHRHGKLMHEHLHSHDGEDSSRAVSPKNSIFCEKELLVSAMMREHVINVPVFTLSYSFH